ncbi:MAG: hypothetical protein AAF389_00845 [Gemmatimonadota bacterium]
MRTERFDRAVLTALVGTLLLVGCGPQRNGVYRLAAPYNFAFYDTHEEAARSFYAAHYAHFGAYELLMDPGVETPSEMAAFEAQVRDYVVDPPKFEPPAEVVAPEWSRMAFETGQAMDWTHMLHSQLYDILTDDRVEDRRAAGERAISYYLSESGGAFSTRGYGHRWMEGGGPWVGAFRDTYPGVNGILWAYHWHHAAVYEALMPTDPDERRERLDHVIQIFTDSVLADPPTEMPLTAEVAPEFSRLFPAAAHIFDNLHMMHDVVNDIMAFPEYGQPEKAAEIDRLLGLMVYAGQDTISAPGMPMMGDHAMSMGSMRVPTELPDGSWLPQGHPDARMAPMSEFMMPLAPVRGGGS